MTSPFRVTIDRLIGRKAVGAVGDVVEDLGRFPSATYGATRHGTYIVARDHPFPKIPINHPGIPPSMRGFIGKPPAASAPKSTVKLPGTD